MRGPEIIPVGQPHHDRLGFPRNQVHEEPRLARLANPEDPLGEPFIGLMELENRVAIEAADMIQIVWGNRKADQVQRNRDAPLAVPIHRNDSMPGRADRGHRDLPGIARPFLSGASAGRHR
jgi:hypothetical protein